MYVFLLEVTEHAASDGWVYAAGFFYDQGNVVRVEANDEAGIHCCNTDKNMHDTATSSPFVYHRKRRSVSLPVGFPDHLSNRVYGKPSR